MSQQPGTPRRSVALAAAALIVSVAAFAAAFYVYDGMGVVNSLLSGSLFSASAPEQPVKRPSTPATSTIDPDGLALPSGVGQDFALGLWRDQADTQATITDLIEGRIDSMRIVDVERKGDESVLNAVVRYSDGATAAGIIVMQRLGGVWYLAYTEASLADSPSIRPTGELPKIGDIDTALLGTMLAEQYKSRQVTEDYALGNVKNVTVKGVTRGPDTATIELEMVEKQGVAQAQVVAIRSEVKGKPVWLLARFTKTKDTD